MVRIMITEIKEASEYIKERTSVSPEILIVLGSGFSSFVEAMDNCTTIDYKDIPHFPQPTVEGHSGKLVFGIVKDRPVMVMAGRFHLYEGHAPQRVAFPIYVAKFLGVKGVIVTNAAGGDKSGVQTRRSDSGAGCYKLHVQKPSEGPER
ncbi:Purine nucleoside phosphorylase [Thermotoga neapolitana DSM 4359]|uniref:purine-nucleoside phosphorylase n=1 Tax=Thermotoga neapolitana (strain ATCC 49049 / DSM 4359 / NBRC 107923 / NS-E) TaxID=309803 RepID=B9K7V5_THENN|nr:Purine nucleoside phosphorylase [Thermotoga neapolitana DSM 4359]